MTVKKRLFNNRGISVVSVLIGMGAIVTLIVVGMQLTSNVSKQRTKSRIPLRMQEIRNNIKTLIANDDAWEQTINHATNSDADEMDCLKNDTDCKNKPTVGNEDFLVANPDGTTYYDSTVATSGFDLYGNPCTTYSTTPAQTSKCLFRMELTWAPICDAAAIDCFAKPVRITGTITYTPPTAATSAKFKEGKYSFNIIRKPRSFYDVFSIIQTQPNGSFGGSCGAANTYQDLPWATVVESDSSQLVEVNGGDNTLLDIKAGTYNCRVTAPGYNVDAHGLRVIDVTKSTTLVVGTTSFASQGQTRATAEFRTTFYVDSQIRVQHICGAVNSGADLGVSTFTGDTEYYAIIRCQRE